MAAAIGGRVTKAGHTVEVISRDHAKARTLADQLAAGATAGHGAQRRQATSSSSPSSDATDQSVVATVRVMVEQRGVSDAV